MRHTRLFTLATSALILGSAMTIIAPSATIAEGNFFPKPLRAGMKNDDVRRLQVFLKQYPNLYPEGLVTGKYGALTRAAVRRLQRQYGLRQTGTVDASTRAQLNRLVERLAAEPVASSPAPAATDVPAAPPPPPQPAPPPEPAPPPRAALTQQPPYFSYSWRAGADLTGEVTLPTSAPRPVVVLNGTRTIIPQTNAAVRLADVYHIALSDEELPWDENTSGMLFEQLRRLPDTQFKQADYRPWKAVLTASPLANDVEIRGRTVRFEKDAFTRSNPTLQPSADGNGDRVFYSNRLYRAVLRAFYNDYNLLKEVFEKRFGYELGYGIPSDEFQTFTEDELQYLAAVFEDLPAGYRNLPGLKKIVRRKTGLSNPEQPTAPAIAQINMGYIEFMDKTFESGQAQYITRLVAHEATHFLWHNAFSEATRAQFTALSGWREQSKDVWAHRTTANFVSDYAATVNPDEDFAETVSYYIYQPDLVRTLAPEKYDFAKKIVTGYEYILLVDERYTFQVFNLDPDVTFPGKIMGVDIEVRKDAAGDNLVRADLRLSPKFGDGAEEASARIVSPAGTYVDHYFRPVSGDRFLLRAEFTLSQYAAAGYWAPEAITVRDQADNRRYESQMQFGWLLYVNNPDEDLDAPVADTGAVGGVVERRENGEYVVRVTVPVTDAHPADLGGSARLVHPGSNQYEDDYAEYKPATGMLVYEYAIRSYRASGEWRWREFSVWDTAGNSRRYDLKDRELVLSVQTPRPDYKKPELDPSAIRITAKPRRPARPDGETDVAITYAARDDNAGLGWVSYTLLKPNGDSLFDYHYHENFYTMYFEGGRPDDWKTYTIKLTLPPGSLPGTWALREIVLHDKADNILTTNFVEVGILKNFSVL